jgi:hypothetical protein
MEGELLATCGGVGQNILLQNCNKPNNNEKEKIN